MAPPANRQQILVELGAKPLVCEVMYTQGKIPDAASFTMIAGTLENTPPPRVPRGAPHVAIVSAVP
jgi:hypothetical protein